MEGKKPVVTVDSSLVDLQGYKIYCNSFGSSAGSRACFSQSPVVLWVCSGLRGRILAQQVQPGVPAELCGAARFAGDATQPGRAVPLLKGWDCHLCGERGMV